MSEPRPGPSFLFSALKKRPKLLPLTANEKTIAMNVYKHVKKTMATYPYKTEVLKTTAEIMGVSNTTIYNIFREHKKTGTVKGPSEHRPPRQSIINKMDDFIMSAIRAKVHQFYFNNDLPTLDKILHAINDDQDLPSFSRTTLYRILKHLSFVYQKLSRITILIDRPDLMIWRRNYLLHISNYRKENRKIYYLDETWVNEGHTVDYVWLDNDIQSSRQAFLRGLSTGLQKPQKGKRFIVAHIGSIDGFLKGGLAVFEAKKIDGDYHNEMESNIFENWFQKILHIIEPGSVIVMDNAPYHSRKIESLPNLVWKKDNIQSWLREKGIQFEPNDTKAQLLAKICKETYVTDDVAEKIGIIVLRLPPYHCELNPIEMIWAQVKSYVARYNKIIKMPEVNILLEEALATIGAAQWRGCINHVIKEEKKMMVLQGLMDAATDGISEKNIIDVGDISSTDEADEFDSN